MSYGTVQAEKVTTESGYSLGAGNASSFKNRIINGGMQINQRGFSGTPSAGAYLLDRYFYNANASRVTVSQSTDAPTGFTNSLFVTSSAASSIGSSDYTNLCQVIEGYNVSDLAWGSASAKSVTLSFWVKSSLTGTFGGALRNKGTGGYYGYPFTYTISVANTWTYVSITIAGPTSTSYTWDTDNTQGIYVWWDFGTGSTYTNTAGSWVNQNVVGASGTTKLVETNGATWKMTGAQLEVGTVATSFDFRSYGTELALCQRYYYRTPAGATYGIPSVDGYCAGGYFFGQPFSLPVVMRAKPTGSLFGTFSLSNCSSLSVVDTDAYSFYVAAVTTATGAVYIHSNSNGGVALTAEL